MSVATPPAPAATSVVVANGLRKRYTISRPPREVLRGVSLEVTRGEFVAIMGPSGCGKSTLLHILGGLEPPDAGTVTVDGRSLYDLDDDALSAFRRDRIGFVFQFFNLIPNLTAAENIALPLRIAGGRGSTNDRVGDLMRDLNLRNLQGHRPEEISGGEQQRVAIARAVANAPGLLLADEPTGNLDPATSAQVFQSLFSLVRHQGVAALIATHNMQLAGYMDRVFALKDGRLVEHT